jgi:putative NIF3 family GTP cyclohydrolase 1 type 2
MIERVKRACGVDALLQVGDARGVARTLAVGCGSSGSLYRAAAEADVYVTGELRHHDALAAANLGVTVLCVGHSNSERLTLKPLAARLRTLAAPVEAILSRCDRDPMRIQ